MNKYDLQNRTKKFALRIIKLVESLPKTTAGFVVGKQLLRSGTSVAANYRAVCRARSTAEFLSKLCIVEEEADESCFWLEVIVEAELLKKSLVESLLNEANQIVAIIVSSEKTAKSRR